MIDAAASPSGPIRPKPRGLRRGVYVLPTLFTVGNIYCGFLSVERAFFGDFRIAAILIFVAALCDALDGRIARMTGSSSEFGEQYDSLCDVVSFGFTPAFLAWRWGLTDLGRWGFFAAFVFLICGSMRLARFNIMVHRVDKRFFIGLPIPAGAGVVASVIFWHPAPLEVSAGVPREWEVLWALVVVIVSFLMISTIRYRSFKDFDLKQRKSKIIVLLIAVVLAILSSEPQIALAATLTAYALSGPIARLFGRRKKPAPPSAQETNREPPS